MNLPSRSRGTLGPRHRRLRTLTFGFALVSSMGISAASAVAAPDDQIYRVGVNRPLNATVKSENVREVIYTLANTTQEQRLDAARVSDIVYEDAPAAYTKGREFLEAGDITNAITQFKSALSAKTRGDWITEYANFYLGEAYLREGGSSYPSAVAAFDAVLSAKADSRFLALALRDKGMALTRSEKPDDAAKAFDELVAKAKQYELGVQWEARGLLWKAVAYEENGVPAKAKSAFRDAGSFASANAKTVKDEALQDELGAIAGRAQLSEGVALLQDGKYSEAKRTFERIAGDDANPASVVAGARNGIAEALLGEKDARRAYEEFARVRVTYFLEREEAARATYFMGMCCDALGSKEPGGKRKARMYFQEVVDHYSDTSWANKAKSELN